MTGSRRKVAALAATLSVGALAALPQAASADLLAPDSPASSNADATQTMYWIGLAVSLLVIVGIAAALLRAATRRGGDDAEPERRTRGSRGIQLRVGIGLAAAALVLAIVGIVFTQRALDVSAAEADQISIQVTGQQWLWRYEYPEANATTDGYSTDTPYSYYDLYIPVDTPIKLNIGSTDTIHRWWVPSLARAVDAAPGDSQSVTFVADEEGTYYGRSTEFSGPGYSTMRTAVHVVSQDEYEAFLKERTADINEARAAIQKQVDKGTAPGVALEEGDG